MVKDKVIVLSGINLYEGGPLSVYKDFLNAMKNLGILSNNRVILFVHKEELFYDYEGLTEIIELPKSRRSYLHRLYYEYIFFKRYSYDNNIDYWISLHDVTPKVLAKHQFTYCHQPTPFYKPGKMDWRFSKKICFFSKFYKYLYGINIKKNDAVIVQQEWIRRKFEEKYGIKNIVVAKPNFDVGLFPANLTKSSDLFTFIYAAFPRSFKNFEVIFEACRILGEDFNYRVQMTIDGTENAYSKYLKRKYGDIKNVDWLGIRPRSEVFELYSQSNCMIFPSKLETWGLPISEFKQTGKPIIIADLPYAHETVGEYNKAEFFNCNDPVELARYMKKSIMGGIFQKHNSIPISAPYADNWAELCEFIFRDSK